MEERQVDGPSPLANARQGEIVHRQVVCWGLKTERPLCLAVFGYFVVVRDRVGEARAVTIAVTSIEGAGLDISLLTTDSRDEDVGRLVFLWKELQALFSVPVALNHSVVALPRLGDPRRRQGGVRSSSNTAS